MPCRGFEQIASLVQKRIDDHPSNALPSMASLAREYGVAYQTMWKAMQTLAKRGVIVCRKGARTVRAGVPRGPDSRDRFIDTLRSMILQGELKAGEAVPKFDYLQTSHRVQRSTISLAVRALLREGLLHKRGRRWIVGSAAASGGRSRRTFGSEPGTVLLLFPWDVDAQHFFREEYLNPFVAAFAGELTKPNLGIRVARQNRLDVEPPGYIAGFEQIRAFVGALGGRYRGTLAHSVGINPRGTGSAEEERHRECLAMLAATGKPIVQFCSDYFDVPRSLGDFGPRVPYYRFYCDEPAAIGLAVEHLAQKGHRLAGFPTIAQPPYLFVKKREDMIREAAQSQAHPLRVVGASLDEPFWGFADPAETASEDFFQRIQRVLGINARLALRGKERVSIQSALRKNTPSLTSLIDAGVTSLIAPNDHVAQLLYWWLVTAGIEIPKEMSVISFDNSLELTGMPITTIDFGFSRLGYLAAHVFIGDIPVKKGADGSVPGICTVVDRGSVGPPIRR